VLIIAKTETILFLWSAVFINKALYLIDDVRHHLNDTVEAVIGRRCDIDHAAAAVLDHKEAERGNLDTGSVAAHVAVALGTVIAAAAGTKAKAHLGYRDDGQAVRRGDGVADDGIGINQLLDPAHGHIHDLADPVLFHVRPSFLVYPSRWGVVSSI